MSNVFIPQLVLILALLVLQFPIDKEDLSFAIKGFVLVDDEQGRRYACAIK